MTDPECQKFTRDVFKSHAWRFVRLPGDVRTVHLEATPAESTTYRLATSTTSSAIPTSHRRSRGDKRPYYTNSSSTVIATGGCVDAPGIQDASWVQTPQPPPAMVPPRVLGEKLPDWEGGRQPGVNSYTLRELQASGQSYVAHLLHL